MAAHRQITAKYCSSTETRPSDPLCRASSPHNPHNDAQRRPPCACAIRPFRPGGALCYHAPAMSRFDPLFRRHLDSLDQRHMRRILRPVRTDGAGRIRGDGRTLINFSSNGYLGLSAHPLPVERACAWTRRRGTRCPLHRDGKRLQHGWRPCRRWPRWPRSTAPFRSWTRRTRPACPAPTAWGWPDRPGDASTSPWAPSARRWAVSAPTSPDRRRCATIW